MDLNEVLVFTRVVQAGSFIAASARLGIPKSTVSRKVADLEKRLNARLLQRTTRKLSLTDVGRTYFDQCARIVSQIEDAERAVSSLQSTPRGPLRVTVGPSSAVLGPIIGEYLKRYPDVRIELVATPRTLDLVEEQFDVGIRAGALPDSTLVARSLGRMTWLLGPRHWRLPGVLLCRRPSCAPATAGPPRLERPVDARSRGLPEHASNLSEGENLPRSSPGASDASPLAARPCALREFTSGRSTPVPPPSRRSRATPRRVECRLFCR